MLEVCVSHEALGILNTDAVIYKSRFISLISTTIFRTNSRTNYTDKWPFIHNNVYAEIHPHSFFKTKNQT